MVVWNEKVGNQFPGFLCAGLHNTGRDTALHGHRLRYVLHLPARRGAHRSATSEAGKTVYSPTF